MGTSKELADYITDMLEPLGEIRAHRMFGGYGIKYGEVNFALLLDDLPYFRTDDASRPVYEEHGSSPFQYMRKGKLATLGNYWEVPADILEEPDIFRHWARTAIEAAIRAHKPKRKNPA
ncbi:MAG: TfoX/Sxy family protein [Nisaea sp.]|uniref:TfoX/Sxy family protein n=1 Tax=Nisaea sp. TaxID=2024842 RepID=UPI001B2F1BC1|nr:TfoX/Sxy family protein [Nisaea sp.]MBO6562582.1 TfoX/Sxy family protein [Nisaea sp.]